MDAPRVTVALTVDHDAITDSVRRGDGVVKFSDAEFGARVGAKRILALFGRRGIPATWFVSGHTLTRFADDAHGTPRRRPRTGLSRLVPRGLRGIVGGRAARRPQTIGRGRPGCDRLGAGQVSGTVLVGRRRNDRPRRGACLLGEGRLAALRAGAGAARSRRAVGRPRDLDRGIALRARACAGRHRDSHGPSRVHRARPSQSRCSSASSTPRQPSTASPSSGSTRWSVDGWRRTPHDFECAASGPSLRAPLLGWR